MKKIYFILNILILNLLIIFPVLTTESKYFYDGEKLFKEKRFGRFKILV